MTLMDDISDSISGLMTQPWKIASADRVPRDSEISLTGNAVRFEGTVLYADMKRSSELTDQVRQEVAGRVYQSYLRSTARIITELGGIVTAYDGDRIMGIFTGNKKNTMAASCALKINYIVTRLLLPLLTKHFQSLINSGFSISHCVGIDTSTLTAIRAGQRTSNDIVWVGRAANLAAKLSDIRNSDVNSFISESVYSNMLESAKYSSKDKSPMWKDYTYNFHGKKLKVYGSSWTRTL